jgi:hypothetical protein
MNEYIPLLFLFLFSGALGAIGLFARHVHYLRIEEEEAAKRNSLDV